MFSAMFVPHGAVFFLLCDEKPQPSSPLRLSFHGARRSATPSISEVFIFPGWGPTETARRRQCPVLETLAVNLSSNFIGDGGAEALALLRETPALQSDYFFF